MGTGKTQVNGGRVKGVERLRKLNGDGITLVQPLRYADQDMTEVLKNAPVPALVRIGKGRAGDITTEAKVIQLLPVRVQAGFDIP